MSSIRSVALALSTVLVAALLPALHASSGSALAVAVNSAAAPAPAARDVKVIHSNISGAQPVGGGGNGGPQNIDRVVEVLAGNPDTTVVTMNEVCWNQALYFLQYRAWNWAYSWTTPNKAPDDEGQRFCPEWQPNLRPLGEFIASPWPLTNPLDFCLEYDNGVRDATCDDRPGSQVSLLCVDMNYKNQGRLVTVCTTHLPATGSAATNASEIRQFLKDTYPVNRPIILTGDLNENPQNSSLNPLYRQRLDGQVDGPGDFLEADQTNESAFGQPFNYTAQCRLNAIPRL